MNRKQAADLLGCSPHDKPDAIIASYRRMMRKHHSDITGVDDPIIRDINIAKETLISHSSLSNVEAKPIVAKMTVKHSDFNGLYPIEGWCKACNNHSGFVFPTEGPFCLFCNGRGCIGGRYTGDLPCSVCLGSGFTISDSHRCKQCFGGSKTVLIHVKYTIPENAKSGDIIHEEVKPEYGYEKIMFVLE